MVTADLSQPSRVLSEALRDADTVVHLAGVNEVATRIDPVHAGTETVAAARTVIAAATEARVRRLVYVSTVHVYGRALRPGRVISEATATQPVDPYSEARLTVERLLAALPGEPEVVIFRLSNSVGAPIDPAVDRWSLVANDLCRQVVTSGAVRLETPGTQWRDFIPLSDVIDVLCQSALGSLRAGTYNLATGQTTSVLGLARLVRQVASRIGLAAAGVSAPEATDLPSAPYRFDVSKLTAARATPTSSLTAAVEETLRFCIAHRQELTLPR